MEVRGFAFRFAVFFEQQEGSQPTRVIAMRWVIAIATVATLIIIDEASYRGIYLDAANRMFGRIFQSFGLV
jgi:hypothetical protein